MKKFTTLGGLLMAMFIVAFTTGCGQNVLAKTLGPQDPVFDATPVPTAGPTPTTSTAKTMYLKITAGSPGTASTIASVQIWVVKSVALGGGTEWIYNGPVTLDSTNSYAWASPSSNPYTTSDGSFYFSMTTPSNQGTYNEVHKVAGATDTVIYQVPSVLVPANSPDGGNFGF